MADQFAIFGCKGGAIQGLTADGTPIPDAFWTDESIVSIEESREAEVKELLGGVGQTLDETRSDARGTYTVTMRMTNPALRVFLFGGTLVEDENGDVSVTRKPSDRGGFFRLVGISGAAGNGSGFRKTIHKAKAITDAPLSLTDNEYTEVSFEIRAYKDANGNDVSEKHLKTALDLDDLTADSVSA